MESLKQKLADSMWQCSAQGNTEAGVKGEFQSLKSVEDRAQYTGEAIPREVP